MNPLLSQILGLGLAVSTAIGCIAYERLVKAYSLGTIVLLTVSFYIPFILIWVYLYGKELRTEIPMVIRDHPMSALIYWVTFITTPLWYIITRKQGLVTSSLYEVKYIVILALLYIWFGEGKFTWNTAIGTACALTSIYFISKK